MSSEDSSSSASASSSRSSPPASPSRSSSSSSAREVAKAPSKSTSSSSSSSEEKERITTKNGSTPAPRNEDAQLIHRISSKLKIDAAKKINSSPSKSDLASEMQSPRIVSGNATGVSELHPDLFLACFEGDLAKVKELLGEDPKLIKVVDPKHATSLLHHAASGGSVEVIKYLLDKGAVLDQTDNESVGAIHYAAIHGKPEAIKELIKRKTKLLNTLTSKLQGSPAGTPIFLSAFFNHLKAFTELLKGGSDVTTKDSDKRTLLHFVIFKNRIMMFDELIAHDSVKKIVDEVDDKGDTALHYAIAKKNVSMVDALIKAGANLNIADADGATPCIAATKDNLFAAVKSLLTKGAKVLTKDKKGKQALDYASELGHNDIQYYLVNSGGDVSVLYNGKNKQGLQKVSDDPTDKYGFFINQPLYKKLIVTPNDLSADVSDKLKQKYTKLFSKPKDKILKNKATMKKLKKAIASGKLPISARKELWKKVLLSNDDGGDKKKKKKGDTGTKFEHPKLDECFAKALEFKFVLQIDKDIERCMRIHKDLHVRYGPGQCRLFKILRAYAGYDQETCYTQGMATVAAIVLMHFDDDNEAFAALVALFQRYKLHDWYRNDLLGLREEVFSTISAMMDKYLKKAKMQLDSLHIAPSLIMTPWCLELFFSNLPYELVIRFWDFFILLGPNTLYRMCLAIMKLNQDNIWAAMDVEGIYTTLKGNPIRDIKYEKVFKTALDKKYNWSDKQMAKFLAIGKDLASPQGMEDKK